MELIYNNNRFECICSYDEKNIPKSAGFWWDPDWKCWHTEKIENAEKLQRFAGNSTNDILTQKIAELNMNVGKSSALSSTIDIPVPDGLKYLPFQKAGIEYCQNKKSVLLADEMGLGKTIQTIGVINLNPKINNVIVVCPASLKINWRRELEKWLVRPYSISVLDTKNKNTDADIIICNYEMLSKFKDVLDSKWDLLIVDECHYIKNYKTKRSQSVQQIAGNSTDRIFITGTPIVNRPSELYSIISTLGFRMGFWDYMKKYANAYQTQFGWDMSGASNLSELQELLRKNIMVRRLKKDVLTELPPKRRHIISIPETGLTKYIKTEKQFTDKYNILVSELKREQKHAEESGNDAEYKNAVNKMTTARNIHFSEMSRIRHETAVAKIPFTVDYISDMLENTDKLVVFAHHHDVIEGIQAAFPDISVVLTGQTNQTDRQKAVDKFQTDPSCKLFIGSIQAAGVGITLTASNNVVFAELDWVPGNMSQAEDRCHRIGTVGSVLIQHLVIDGSIDSLMATKLIQKQEIIEQALDGMIK